MFIEFIPRESYIDEGIWQIKLTPVNVVDGRVDMWLPSQRTSLDTRFLKPSVSTTLTVPSTSSRVITVGAYDA